MIELNRNWVIRLEYFGGILFNRDNKIQYRTSAAIAILLKLVSEKFDFNLVLKQISNSENLIIVEEEIEELKENGVIVYSKH